jgi:23S rRNA (uracil1939-C5)-methyltransferase
MEDADEGMLRYVQATVERRTGRVQLTLVWNADDYREATPALQLLVKELNKAAPDLFHSVWANFRTGPGNAIFSRNPTSWHRCSGSEFITEKVGSRGHIFYFGPQLFRQANLDHFEGVVNAVAELVPEGSDVCELYAGIGILGVNALGRARSVRCSDINAFNPRAFSRVVAQLESADRGRVSYSPLSAEDAIQDGQAMGADCLIVDPPRKGLDAGVLESLRDRGDPLTASVKRIIYVSCGLDAFKRDCAQLVEAGWALQQAEGHVLFPGSDHIETVALLERR